MKTLHFGIGEGFGSLLTDIAQEALIYDLNLKKAFKVIKDSLIGVSDEIAFNILIGNYLLKEDVETQKIIVDNKNNNRLIDFRIKEKIEKYNYDLTSARTFLAIEGNKTPTININYSRKQLNNYFKEDNVKAITDIVDREFSVYAASIKLSMNLLNEVIVQYKLWEDIVAKGKEFNIDVNIDEDLLRLSDDYYKLYRMIQLPDADIIEEKQFLKNIIVDNYLDTIKAIDGITLEGIKPVNILDGYNAGWLSPEGDYYGLNGEIANMLHNNIADMLLDVGIIPEDFNNEINETVWLEQNGWVKQHGNWILFAGYERSALGEKDVPITKKQINALYKFGQKCHKGSLLLGFRRKRISAVNLPLIDPLMFKMKWFKL